jgi:predicted acylesterase/phospholipase RssA
VRPRVRGRDLLVDGSSLDNMPVEAMAAPGEGPIVAVDVQALLDRAPPGRDAAPSPRRGETLLFP